MPDLYRGGKRSVNEYPLSNEELDFINAIKSGRRPAVTGEDGRRALETAIAITSQIKASI